MTGAYLLPSLVRSASFRCHFATAGKRRPRQARMWPSGRGEEPLKLKIFIAKGRLCNACVSESFAGGFGFGTVARLRNRRRAFVTGGSRAAGKVDDGALETKNHHTQGVFFCLCAACQWETHPRPAPHLARGNRGMGRRREEEGGGSRGGRGGMWACIILVPL